MNFEEGTKELEKIIESLDSEETTLEDSILLFQKGVDITKECLKVLNEAKGTITKIKEDLDKFTEVEFD